MTTAAAQAAINRMESDEAFAERLKDAGSPDMALGILHAEGFEVTQQDMRDAALDRFSDKLSPEQLEQVAGGLDLREVTIASWGAALGVIAIGAATAAV